MKVILANFAGEVPKLEPEYYPDNVAFLAREARLERGNLEPMRTHSVRHTLSTSSRTTIYLHNNEWIDLAGDFDAVQGPVAQDRLYVTNDTPDNAPPRLYVQSAAFWSDLALPAPTVRPTLATVGAINNTLRKSVLYAYTWVTQFGEESAPSPLSLPLSWSPNQTVDVTTSTSPPAGRGVTHKRIYRSETTATGATDLFFVREIAVAIGTWNHNLANDPIQEVISTKDFDPPPNGMQGIIAMPNGMMAAFKGSEVLFCEPYQPHAWPSKYTLTVNDPIVGLVAFGTSVAVLTRGQPYVIQGLHPDSMAMTRIEVDLPCVAKRGIVDMGYAAIYPTHAGLAQINESGASLISEGLWTRALWQTLIRPATIAAAQYLNRYVFSYEPDPALPGQRQAMMIDLKGDMPFTVPFDRYDYKDLWFDIKSGSLYGLAGNSIREVDPENGAPLVYQWRSRQFRFPVPVSFGVLKVVARPPSTGTPYIEVQVYADGALKVAHTSVSGLPRIPTGKHEQWQIRLISNWTITSVTMCGSPEELRA